MNDKLLLRRDVPSQDVRVKVVQPAQPTTLAQMMYERERELEAAVAVALPEAEAMALAGGWRQRPKAAAVALSRGGGGGGGGGEGVQAGGGGGGGGGGGEGGGGGGGRGVGGSGGGGGGGGGGHFFNFPRGWGGCGSREGEAPEVAVRGLRQGLDSFFPFFRVWMADGLYAGCRRFLRGYRLPQ